MKLLYEHDRSCHCAKKDSVRQVLPDRTAGWQFAVDPCTGKVLGAYEHRINERNEDKVDLLQQVLSMPLVSADLLLHDDACHFESYVKKYECEGFENIKYYMVDCFHMKNHRCSKSTWTPRKRNVPRMSAPTCLRPSMPGFDHWISFSIVCARILTNFGWRKQFSSITNMLSPCHLSCHLGRVQSLVPCVPSKTWHCISHNFVKSPSCATWSRPGMIDPAGRAGDFNA